MPARARSIWKLSVDGQYVRQIGWTVSRTGKRTQAKFRLGANRKEAKRRDEIIRQIWDQLERLADGKSAIWTEVALMAAKTVAATGRALLAAARMKDEGPWQYVGRIADLREALPMVAVQPLDEQAEHIGRTMYQCNEAFAVYNNFMETGEYALPKNYDRVINAPKHITGPTLHDGLRAYSRWLEAEYADPQRKVTAWGRTQMRQVALLIDRHDDLPLAKLDYAAIETLIRYWRKRPVSRANASPGPVAKKSAENFIKTLKGFFKWLHRTEEFVWSRPDNLDDIKTRVELVDTDRLPQLMVDDVFTLHELGLLYQYATPLERTFLLLSLNCHFGGAEISSLMVGEVFLRTPHSKKHQEVLGFTSSKGDSFIRRLRRKSGVYGEWLLFPQTVAALEEALERRKGQPGYGPEARLLLNAKGQSYDAPTASGNANQQIANRFADLTRRIQNDGHPEFAKRSFKSVRKTAASLIREIADGEIQGLFTCHGRPVALDDLADVYAVRPFGKLFGAIRFLQERLTVVFGQTTTPMVITHGNLNG